MNALRRVCGTADLSIFVVETDLVMKEYLFYSPEGECISPSGRDIENFQVLGFANGETTCAALSSLLQSNPWIRELGYKLEEIICVEVVR